jgi:hypothetical protein
MLQNDELFVTTDLEVLKAGISLWILEWILESGIFMNMTVVPCQVGHKLYIEELRPWSHAHQ